MKEKIIKFVDENYDVIKANFYKAEVEILEELEDELPDVNELINYLNEQLKVSKAEELIEVINERSLGVDLDNEEDADELFQEIKFYSKMKF